MGYMEMSVKLISDKGEWDRFIDESPQGTLFHKWDFLKIAEKYSGTTLLPYGIYDAGELTGVMQFFINRKYGLRMAYSPPRYTLSYIPYMSFVMGRSYEQMTKDEKESQNFRIMEDINGIVRKLSPDYVSITLPPWQADIRQFRRYGYVDDLMYTYIVDLTRPIEEIRDALDPRLRTKIRAYSKLDIKLERVNNVDDFFMTMRDLLKTEGQTFYHKQSPEYLKELLLAFPDDIKMYSLVEKESCTGYIVNCNSRDNCIGWMMGRGVVNNDIDSNEYLMWSSIKKAKEDGFKTYEIFGASERRLNAFKSKFSPVLKPYFYVIKKSYKYQMAEYGRKVLGKAFKV